MTRKSFLGTVISAAALLLSFVVFSTSRPRAWAQSDDNHPPFAANILFGDGQVTDNRFAVRAFVPTGSLNTNCLATLSESNNAVPGMTVFCAPREFQGQQGILFSAFFPQPIPSGLILSATIHQDHASGYGPPVFYPE
jgi:hypothetical protein